MMTILPMTKMTPIITTASLLLCLLLLGIVCRIDRIEAFLTLNRNIHHNKNVIRSRSSYAIDSSFPTSKLISKIDDRTTGRITATMRRRMTTIDTQSTTTTNNSTKSNNNVVDAKQKVIFQKVIRPTKDLPEMLFLGYLVEYLEIYFELPTNLAMTYEKVPINDDDEEDQQNRCILAWDSPLSTSSEATRMEVEVIGIYTDSNKNKDKNDSNDAVPASSSVPNMAMVVVRKSNDIKTQKMIPPMMKGLFDDSEKRIVQALDRGLDDFVSGRIKFDMDDDRAEKRTTQQQQDDDDDDVDTVIPRNVKTAEEAIDAELVDDYPEQKRQRSDPEDVVFDAYATTDDTGEEDSKNNERKKKKKKVNKLDIDNNNTDDDTPPKIQRKSKIEIAEAKARAIATMQKPADVVINNKQSTSSKPSVASVIKNSIENNSGVDFAVAAARRAAELREKKRKNLTVGGPNEDSVVTAARRKILDSAKSRIAEIAENNNSTIGRTSKRKGNTIRGMSKDDESSTKGTEPKTTEGQPKEIPEGWKPKDHFKDQRLFSATISQPPKTSSKVAAKRRVTTATKNEQKSMISPPPSIAATASSVKTEKKPAKESISKPDELKPSKSSEQQNAILNESIQGKRNLNVKVVDGSGPDADADPLIEQARKKIDISMMSEDFDESTTSKKPSENEIEMEVMKAAKTAMDDIADQGLDMTPEEMLKDILQFDEDKKKEEEPGSGFVSGAFEKAKELMKDRHQQIQERKQQQVGFKEVEKKESIRPNIVNPYEDTDSRELTPEEELRQMFAAGQKIADGKINQSTGMNDAGSSIKATGTTEKDVDRLIAEEKTVSKYARVLDDELVELEVRINSSPASQLDGPQQNPIFDVMSGPEVYNPNVDQDAVNYPGAIPGTADVKLPKELSEAIKQAKFATGVLMNLKLVETKDSSGNKKVQYFSGEKELSTKQVENLQTMVEEASRAGIIDDPVDMMAERSRLQLLLDELWDQPEERYLEIASNYKELLLSDRLVALIRDRLTAMADRDLDALRRDDESLREPHEKERDILGQLVVYAQSLLKEVRALGAELEAHQLEIVRSICKVAMDPSHTTEEETAMALSDAVRDMRPLLDDAFVAYLKYAVAEEESKLARAGVLDDPDYNQWLFVLKIVQQGVYAEIAKGINRYIDHITYVLRMETPRQRRLLLEKLIDDMPTLDVRPFVQVIDSIVGSLGDGVNGNFDGLVELGEMTNKVLQLQHDVQEFLPPDRIAEKSRDADEWAAKQKKRLMEQRKIGEQRLQAAKDTSSRADEVEDTFGSGGGEVDVFD